MVSPLKPAPHAFILASAAISLVPAAAILPGLERAVHDAAELRGRRVRFEASGADQRLDGHVLVPLEWKAH